MNVLICGKNSYVGKSIIKHLSGKHQFRELDMRDYSWKNFDFSVFDTIIFLAAIVHRPVLDNAVLYKQVNEELPVLVAERAIEQGVKHFIFFSTMSVYGIQASLNGGGRVSLHTELKPIDLYGRSKLNAEISLIDLQKKKDFTLNIVRPPNIYGENCPGNYYRYMQNIAKYFFVFPVLRHNQFSMISVERLSEEINKLIVNMQSGLLCPQDKGSKSNAVRIAEIAKNKNKIHLQSPLFGKLLKLTYKIAPLKQISNLFGDLYYDDSLNGLIDFNKYKYPTKINY